MSTKPTPPGHIAAHARVHETDAHVNVTRNSFLTHITPPARFSDLANSGLSDVFFFTTNGSRPEPSSLQHEDEIDGKHGDSMGKCKFPFSQE